MARTIRVEDSQSMTSGHGFAIITALLVLVAVGALATGAFTLAVFNNRLAQNVQTQAVARYNAERGLDAALLLVAQVYGQEVSPTAENLGTPNLPSVSMFEEYWRSLDDGDDRFLLAAPSGALDGGYRPDGSSAEIEVRGFAISSGQVLAEHTVVARFSGRSIVDSEMSTIPRTGPGFVTSGSINVSGKGQYDLNVHAGGDVNVEGTGYVGFSYKSGTDVCELSTFIDPDTGEIVTTMKCEPNQTAPVVSVFDWNVERSKYGTAERPCTTTIGTAELVKLAGKNVYAADLGGGATETVICIDDDVDEVVFQGDISNAVIVGGQNTIVTIEGGSQPVAGSDDGLGLRLIAGGVRLVGSGTLSGRNDIFSYTNVVLDRNVTRLVDDDPSLVVVGTVIKSGRDVVFRGDGNASTYAEIVANRAFCRGGNANADFVGSVEVSMENVTATNLFGNNESCGDTYAIDFRGGAAGNDGFVASLPDEFRTGDRDPVVTYVNRPSQIGVEFRR